MAGKNKEAGRARPAPPSPSQWRWEPKEILLLIFNLVRFWEVVLVFSCWPRHPFCSPPAFLSWLLLGLVVRRKSSWGFLENECWLPFSQLNTRRLTLLKTSTSASGLGQRERGEGKKGKKKSALLHFKSSTSNLGFFGINSWSFGSRADESWQLSIDGLSSGRHADITKDRRGNGKKRRLSQGGEACTWWLGNFTGP